MKKRLIYLFAWLMFLPFVGACLFAALPSYVLFGANAFHWLDAYVNYICGVTDSLNIKRNSDN